MLNLVVAVFLSCSSVSTGVLEGERAVDFTAEALSGPSRSLTDQRGRPLVLAVWASWCGPCREEVPELNKVAAFYGDDLQVLGLNTGETIEVAREAARSLDMAYPSLVDPDGAIAGRYQVSTVPLVLVLDRAGVIRYRGNGLPSHLLSLLDGLIAADG